MGQTYLCCPALQGSLREKKKHAHTLHLSPSGLHPLSDSGVSQNCVFVLSGTIVTQALPRACLGDARGLQALLPSG